MLLGMRNRLAALLVLAAMPALAEPPPTLLLSQIDPAGSAVPRARLRCDAQGQCAGYALIEIEGVEQRYAVRVGLEDGAKAYLQMAPTNPEDPALAPEKPLPWQRRADGGWGAVAALKAVDPLPPRPTGVIDLLRRPVMQDSGVTVTLTILPPG
jgi:hypothetical protein